MRLLALAKINLGLEVLGQRRDGYHELRTLFQSISLADEIEITERTDGRIYVSGDDPSISWGEDNLIFQAALKMQKMSTSTRGVEVRVKKRIPPGSGLGGGSSDAAVILMALNLLWKLRLPLEELTRIGQQLGADVPYFFHGGLCLGEGRGDFLQPLPDMAERAVLLVLPRWTISTRWVFQHLVVTLTSAAKVSKINQFLKDNNLAVLANELEETVFSRYPQLRKIKEAISETEAELSSMSGSGSVIYGLFRDKKTAAEVGQKIGQSFPEVTVKVVRTVNRFHYWQIVGVGV
jgi:4-diphosphocytidyl-2-C-methyl-D-erythritol kinase